MVYYQSRSTMVLFRVHNEKVQRFNSRLGKWTDTVIQHSDLLHSRLHNNTYQFARVN